MPTYLDFEKPIAELESKIEELSHVSDGSGVNVVEEVSRLKAKVERQLRQTYAKLTPWQKAQVARHPERPHFGDYVEALVEDFTPLAGDRRFADDPALIGGLGRVAGRAAIVMGHEKGSDTEGRVRHNFGMPRPEGYRKALRLMRLAERFGLPIVTLVDTPGAFPGVDAEERGQAEAIARCIETGLSVAVPYVAAVIGEGGSGGAIALATADRVLMFEHAIYSVISPEGCASILWRDREHTEEAAEALKLTAQDLDRLGLIDGIVPEPLGGAQRDPAAAAKALGQEIAAALGELASIEPAELVRRRRDKFLAMGRVGLG